MSYQVRYTREAKEDIERLYAFLLERDIQSAGRAKIAMAKAMKFLEDFPFACRKSSSDNPFLREMLIPFGNSNSGYVSLFEIEDKKTVTILAIRHQREEDYH
ncbi:MAG TPA: type II toxin-antitoxin system RelE/ParE family toxin [Desulfobulbus sp.]|nr:type II toxin-antitoxin system RelE/ParE family toxin [Desulfobulbus sp.]